VAAAGDKERNGPCIAPGDRVASAEEMKPRHLISALLALVIAYPFSIGPVAVVYIRVLKIEKQPRWVKVVYGPLRVAADNSPIVEKAFEWYFGVLGL
jgi:hypothetical protein